MQTAQPPVLLPTRVEEGHAPGLTYRIEGELVPVLHVVLDGSRGLFFEHHVVLWKDPALLIGMHPMAGAFKRVVAGMPIFMTETQSPGEIAFSRDDPGHVLSLHLPPGRSIYVREHQFLAATTGIDYTFTRVRGIGNMLFGGTGFFIDRFQAGREEGVVWLHGYGNVFEKVLAGRRVDRRRGRRVGVPRRDGVDAARGLRAEDGGLRRVGPAGLQPVHRAGAGGDPVGVRAPADRELMTPAAAQVGRDDPADVILVTRT